MLLNGVVLIYMLRKVLGHLHVRIGPTELGPAGMFQTIADVLKLFTKEDPTPVAVDRSLYFLAPAVVFVPSFLAYLAMPFGPGFWSVPLDNGLFFMFAVLGFVPIGILMAGWSSNNKWGLLGGMRAVAAQISYEVPLLLSAVGVAMLAGSLNLQKIVEAQAGYWIGPIPHWFIFAQLGGFLIFVIAGQAEISNTPFDMAEAESELIAGFASDYAGMKFGLLFVSEFSNSFIIAALGATLFFGGWLSGLPQPIAGWIDGPIVLLIKAYIGIFFIMWVRGTFPRIRIDQMLGFSWKGLIPAGLLWVLLTGAAIIALKAVG
jgi:NADH-quinone oxidoreductase subunit H